VLDEAVGRWATAAGATNQDPELALTTPVCRLAMDRLRLLRPDRQGGAGPWLPEPLGCRRPDAEMPGLELLMALEALSLLERAAYVLRVLMGCPYAEAASVLGRREPAVRQLVRRARRRLGPITGGETESAQHEVAVERLATACRTATLRALIGGPRARCRVGE
jgi:RNA polymerase sigma-70 factor, ECF subfamily